MSKLEQIKEYIQERPYTPRRRLRRQVCRKFGMNETEFKTITEEVFDEEGNLLFLNDPTEEWSLYTPSYRSIQMPYPNEFNTVAVQYRAAHPKLIWSVDIDPATVDVAVPESLYEALLYYVAHRASPQPIGGQDGAQTFLQKYEMCCQAVEKQ